MGPPALWIKNWKTATAQMSIVFRSEWTRKKNLIDAQFSDNLTFEANARLYVESLHDCLVSSELFYAFSCKILSCKASTSTTNCGTGAPASFASCPAWEPAQFDSISPSCLETSVLICVLAVICEVAWKGPSAHLSGLEIGISVLWGSALRETSYSGHGYTLKGSCYLDDSVTVLSELLL